MFIGEAAPVHAVLMHTDYAGVLRHFDNDLKALDDLFFEFPRGRFEFLRDGEAHDADHFRSELLHPGQGVAHFRVGFFRRFGDRVRPVGDGAPVAVDGDSGGREFLLKLFELRIGNASEVFPEEGARLDVAPAELFCHLDLRVDVAGSFVCKTCEIH